jgi:uncharacterized protein DUF3131
MAQSLPTSAGRMAEASVRLHVALIAVLVVALPACSGSGDSSTARAAVPADAGPTPDSARSKWLTPAKKPGEDSLFRAAAEAAWRFADRNYVEATGLTKPFDYYGVGTMWDVASSLAAMFSATELGLLDRTQYDHRMRRALLTLERLPLFDGIGFNKEYAVDAGRIIGIQHTPSDRGYGISATDNGRLLLWLRIIASRHPQHAASARRVAQRLKMDEFVDDGYLIGRQLSKRTGRTREFQEGRIGYEQYAARGFEVWGTVAANALDIGKNARSRLVSGVEVPSDTRGADRLTSEPFVLLGLEVGWTPAERAVARNVLAAQRARYAETKRLTLVSEDAINRAPDYFFYNTVLSRHGPWSIDVQRPGARLTGPRWLSTKAAFGWHALLPDDYTRMVVDTVRARALVNGVWGSGVFDNGRPTATPNINTAAGVLEAALYRSYGAPLLVASP